jgi:hypothetical protein
MTTITKPTQRTPGHCVAILKSGKQCGYKANWYGGFCTIHYRKANRVIDAAFATLKPAWVDDARAALAKATK